MSDLWLFCFGILAVMTDQSGDLERLRNNLDHRHETVPDLKGEAVGRDLIGQLTVVPAEHRLRSRA